MQSSVANMKQRTTTGKTLVLTRSEAMKEPPLLRLSSPPASTPPGRMSTMALQTLLDSASLAKLPAVSELLALLTLTSHKASAI